MTRLDRVLRRGALALLVAAGLLALAELVARAAFERPVNPYTPHAFLKIVRTPGYQQWKWSIEEPPSKFLFEANALGFRGKSMTGPKKPEGTYRIFFVGASTTENQHLPEEKTFPGLVERALNERTAGRPRVEVANCGIAGFGVARTLSLIQHRLLALEPDLIVVLDGENDLVSSLDERWDPTNALLDADETTLKEWLASRSTLLAVLDNAVSHKESDVRRLYAKRRKLARARPYHVPEGLDLLRGLPTYRRYLRWMALVCREARVPLVFLTQPTIWRPDLSEEERAALWMACLPVGPTHLDPATAARLMASYNDALLEVAREHGVATVDLAAAVPRDLEHFCDDAHLTARGNARVADAIVAALGSGSLPGRVP